jgi:thiamine biosynthesis lipoprotein
MAADPVSQRFTARRLAFALAGIVALAGLMLWRADQFGGRDGERALLTFTGPTMGTTFTVKVVQPRSAQVADADLQALVQTALDRVDVLMSTYRSDSEISRFNADSLLAPVPLSPETAEVIACALKVSEQSAGAYDITVGPLVNAYGFGPGGRRTPPSDAEFEELRRHVGYDKLEFDPAAPSLRKTDPALIIDLNSIAPGFAADLIARGLEGRGILSYMVEIGGEVRARGHNADGELWRVGIEKPIEGERSVQRVVPLDGLALATSGDYRDYYEENGVRISHTLDARTGRPVAHNLASVSVLHPECMWADAYATAIVALGPQDGYLMAEILKLPALFITRQADGSFSERASPAFEERFGPLSAQERDRP